MKKRLFTVTVLCVSLALTGCGAGSKARLKNAVTAEEIDKDYEAVIKDDVKIAGGQSSALQEEIDEIEKIAAEYEFKVQVSETQQEMNKVERWPYEVWQTELENLESRIADVSDGKEREALYAEQKNWLGMLNGVTIADIGPRQAGGSIYPTLRGELWKTIYRKRVYMLAAKLAAVQGEAFEMPVFNYVYGTYVDVLDAEGGYSSLIMKQGMADDEAVICIREIGELRGTFSFKSDGEYLFSAYDNSVKGLIRLKGWNGASFEVTEADSDLPFKAGDRFDFDQVY